MRYRRLEKGEIIQEGDEVESSRDGWRDDAVWEPAKMIGQPAPDPRFPSHRQYRRPISEVVEKVVGGLAVAVLHEARETTGKMADILSVGYVDDGLSQDELAALANMKPGHWYYLVGRFTEQMEKLERMGLVESCSNPVEWATWPGYRKK